MRLLHLAYERPPHRDAVHHAATEDDARLVLHLLASAYPDRLALATTLRNRLNAERSRPAIRCRPIPVEANDGLYRAISWRLAQWLACVLPASDSTIDRTRARIARWL